MFYSNLSLSIIFTFCLSCPYIYIFSSPLPISLHLHFPCLYIPLTFTYTCPSFNPYLYLHLTFTFIFLQDQYIFVYDALLEALTQGDTTIAAAEFVPTFQQLQRVPQGGTRSRLEEQFQHLVTFDPKHKPRDTYTALSAENVKKNRDPDIVTSMRPRNIYTFYYHILLFYICAYYTYRYHCLLCILLYTLNRYSLKEI